ncbi:crotonobetainyl-CoA:carnitine CoA-transferase CaiB-like acyl-CoA transferase [Mesorhizobium robiniae]|uniref:Crotonobetainyl-CoA:carnitine CoA-transferase CaiB-like acyl-CoA transferase n=1 Tax=Mesorhizobium robiniae TaxID=559315 RepID=A0ABV2GYQ4_9HYPH|nr:CaiB/BaiF CoA-transferase family protein [Mesorhizobium sp. ZC-5]MCV3243943.1 CoA transferase [Mesorhizobium sp. ZC-5]
MGVLSGVRIIEMVGLGPAPFCGMILADLGADVIAVERPGADHGAPRPWSLVNRGKRSIVLDLKKPGAVNLFLELLDGADALIEGNRPGVMERLGLGPEACIARRPALVYGRMTGYGQFGPLSNAAGHDANYVALSGALWLATQPGIAPEAPPTILGDSAGGALYLAIGILAGILRARKDGVGQVIDAAMVDGSAHLMSLLLSFLASDYNYSTANARPGALGRHYDRAYVCGDGLWVVVQAEEPKFYAELLHRLGLEQEERFSEEVRHNPKSWGPLSQELAAIFKSKTRKEWCELLENTDTCFTPVLTMEEAAVHPHMMARNVFSNVDGVLQPNPAPRFSVTPSANPTSIPHRGANTAEILAELGVGAAQIQELRLAGALGPS